MVREDVAKNTERAPRTHTSAALLRFTISISIDIEFLLPKTAAVPGG
jgi:hypothetical protein